MRSPGIEDAEDDNVEDDADGVDDDGEAEDLLRVRVGDGEQEAGQQHQVVHQQRLPQVFVENPLSQNLLRHYLQMDIQTMILNSANWFCGQESQFCGDNLSRCANVHFQ